MTCHAPRRTARTLALLLPIHLCCMGLAWAEEAGLPLRAALRIRYERTEGGALITGHGTAFGVDLSGYGIPGKRHVLSAAHNVLDEAGHPYPALKLEIDDGARSCWLRCKVLHADRGLDVCLLEAAEDLPQLARLAAADARMGDGVVMAGSPRGIPVAHFDGVVRNRFFEGTARSVVEIKFDHGCSGGPLFCAGGHLIVGLAVAGIPKDGDLDHTRGLFVPVSALDSFLQPLTTAKPARTPSSVALAPASIAAAPKAELAEIPPLPEAAPPRAESPALAIVQAPAPPAATPTAALEPQPRSPAVQTQAALVTKTQAATPAHEIPATYVVDHGDNLTRIARRFNVAIEDLIKMNDLKNPDRIFAGMTLRVR